MAPEKSWAPSAATTYAPPRYPLRESSVTDFYQVFLNIVLDEATESKPNNEKQRLGMCVIRGNSVVMMEALDRIGGDDRGGHRG